MASATDVPDDGTAPPRRIGAYRLLERLGEGGMGTVWLAEQDAPLRRRVALKLVRAGRDSRAVLARFEQERQALALMAHPHIAAVLDAGGTEDGQPYFVMELVHGVPVTHYCDTERLALPQRLELFLQVCDAVQHAHQKGIIHRDLKPANVLVGLQDGAPTAKVIDFGVAKATGMRLTDLTVVTQAGTIVGTLEYMSPEQAESGGLDVDTRSDVYSLGVLLYELLTGRPPFRVHESTGRSLSEMLRLIREVEPPRPSTCLATSADLPALAAHRRVEPRRLARLVQGDLDWIVMKCLAKERGRRYASAAALAEDIGHYLDHEPVSARPPTTSYRVRKFVRRHLPGVLAAAAFVVLLLSATLISLRLAARAEREAAVAREVSDFLARDLLAQASPFAQALPTPDLTVRELVDRAALRIGGRFEEQPLVEASVREIIGESYGTLGAYERAVEHLERAVALREREQGAGHPQTLAAMARLGSVLGNLRDPRGEQPLRAALDGFRSRAPDSRETLTTQVRLADCLRELGRLSEAEPLFRAAIDGLVARFGERDHDALEALTAFGILLREAGRLEEAERVIDRELEWAVAARGRDDPRTLRARTSWVTMRMARGGYAEARQEADSLVQDSRRVLGPEHRSTLAAVLNLASTEMYLGDFAAAEALATEGLETSRRALGEHDVVTQHARRVLSSIWNLQGRAAEAEPLLVALIEDLRATAGPDHFVTLTTRIDLGANLLQQQRHAEALELFRELEGELTRVLGSEHPATLHVAMNEAYALDGLGRLPEAEAVLEDLVRSCRAAGLEDMLEGALSILGRNLLQQERPAEAEAPLRECVARREARVPEDWRRFNAVSQLGGSLLGQRRFAEAEPLVVSGYEGLKEREARIDAMFRHLLDDAAERVLRLYEEWGRPDEAAAWRARLSR